MPQDRIAKIIAHAGVASRRKAEEMILHGRVLCNGQVVTDVGMKVDCRRDQIVVDGIRVRVQRKVYLVLNKPRGYITTAADENDRKTIYELLPEKYRTLHPVGRLDKETSGLLFLTNDGEFTFRVTHPKFEIRKKYQVSIRGKMRPEDVKKIEEGFKLPEFSVSACGVENLEYDEVEDKTRFLLDIGEGKNREIRKIMEFFKYELLRLHRVQIGGYHMYNVGMSKFRVLSEKEAESVVVGAVTSPPAAGTYAKCVISGGPVAAPTNAAQKNCGRRLFGAKNLHEKQKKPTKPKKIS